MVAKNLRSTRVLTMSKRWRHFPDPHFPAPRPPLTTPLPRNLFALTRSLLLRHSPLPVLPLISRFEHNAVGHLLVPRKLSERSARSRAPQNGRQVNHVQSTAAGRQRRSTLKSLARYSFEIFPAGAGCRIYSIFLSTMDKGSKYQTR